MDRKGCHKSLLIGVLILLGSTVWAQQNLVPNPSFEEYSFCPSSSGQILYAYNWIDILGSVDYYNLCGTQEFGVPANRSGYQQAYDGEAYGGVALWAGGIQNGREFLGIQLTDILKEDSKYLVGMRLNLADTVQYAIRNFGVLFTTNQPNGNLNELLSAVPQVVYGDSAYLDDRIEWMLFEGSFIAQGDEQFMTIGNFDNDSETDTLFVVDKPSKSTYYLIDEVSVVEDTSYHVGINEELGIKDDKLVVWPSPATDVLTIETAGKNMAFELMDVQGKVVLQQTMQTESQNVDVSQLPTGVYVGVLLQKGVAVARRKVVIQR